MATKAKKTKKQKVVNLEALKQINLNAAGLDIGAAEIYAAVPEDRGPELAPGLWRRHRGHGVHRHLLDPHL
jgi:hypothetical protein